MSIIVDSIGVAAVLEQCAEECMELGQACLKMSRKLRDENPTPKTFDDLYHDLIEETADVQVCINEVMTASAISDELIKSSMAYKQERWKQRIKEKKDEKKRKCYSERLQISR